MMYLFIYFYFYFFFCTKTLMSEPEEIATMTGQKIPRKCSIGKYCFRICAAVSVYCSSDFIDFVLVNQSINQSINHLYWPTNESR